MPAQRRFITFPPGQRFAPVRPETAGFLVLRDTQPEAGPVEYMFVEAAAGPAAASPAAGAAPAAQVGGALSWGGGGVCVGGGAYWLGSVRMRARMVGGRVGVGRRK